MCENEIEPDFWFGAPFASNPASKIAILAILGVFHLRGCFELFKKLGQSDRKLPRWWQTKLRTYSPDVWESRKWLAGAIRALYGGLLAQNRKLADRCERPKKC